MPQETKIDKYLFCNECEVNPCECSTLDNFFDKELPLGSEYWVLERHRNEVKEKINSHIKAMVEEMIGEEKQYPKEDMYNSRHDWNCACDFIDASNARRQKQLEIFKKYK